MTERGAKPPQGIRTVPILRQSVSDSGVVRNMENRQQRSRNSSINSFQEEKCKNEFQDERLQKVHEQLEVCLVYKIDNFLFLLLNVNEKEARRKVAAQADVLSAGYEHIVRPPGPPVSGRTDARSRSVETSPSHRLHQNTARYDNLCLI